MANKIMRIVFLGVASITMLITFFSYFGTFLFYVKTLTPVFRVRGFLESCFDGTIPIGGLGFIINIIIFVIEAPLLAVVGKKSFAKDDEISNGWNIYSIVLGGLITIIGIINVISFSIVFTGPVKSAITENYYVYLPYSGLFVILVSNFIGASALVVGGVVAMDTYKARFSIVKYHPMIGDNEFIVSSFYSFQIGDYVEVNEIFKNELDGELMLFGYRGVVVEMDPSKEEIYVDFYDLHGYLHRANAKYYQLKLMEKHFDDLEYYKVDQLARTNSTISAGKFTYAAGTKCEILKIDKASEKILVKLTKWGNEYQHELYYKLLVLVDRSNIPTTEPDKKLLMGNVQKLVIIM